MLLIRNFAWRSFRCLQSLACTIPQSQFAGRFCARLYDAFPDSEQPPNCVSTDCCGAISLSRGTSRKPHFCRAPNHANNRDVAEDFPCYLKIVPCYRAIRSLLFERRFRAKKSPKALRNRHLVIAGGRQISLNREFSLYSSLLLGERGGRKVRTNRLLNHKLKPPLRGRSGGLQLW